ncbi:Acetylornithine deacetylase/Succinyl-diaminopimelate desuccinylase [Nocardia amikacinitolerans]|uniref:Acetylornithine deacetylase/Succinyl-diaminopimelate desuccinylase n=1 Tax=Nocardia amikacinitolerans TaxID=756689 RepID=A0A285LXA5_9NOCA|nr:dipeptidase [Nocardia amikacinitolerans]MCP2279852.1 Acetylornithine deacetylase/Succinyl-diaminopimelate desuccinylase [Nocardia amikacinitolerans]SNY89103.1 Acetylornithine deacetylase/Succinyl-diaminopimelate desuccinylase [Nocardia amikacinitolerans]
MTSDDPHIADLRSRVAALMPQAERDLAQLVSFKSVADARQFPAEECELAAQWVADAFAAVGLTKVGLHETPDGSKTVIASRPAPPGAPTVLLYCHYDVQPPLDEAAWRTPAWELTEKDGRWYGRGAADCKGNIVMHLTALRAIGSELPVGVILVAEGSEEQGTGGLEKFVVANPDLLRADAIVIGDCGNFAAGVPTFTETLRGNVNVIVTVETLAGPLHSGMFGGAAPDALAALIQVLATLRDVDGNTTVAGLDNRQTWDGVQYDSERFCNDAGVLAGVELSGDGTVAEMLWARPALTVLGIDAPRVVGSTAAIQPAARARLNLRIPPGITPEHAHRALVAHLEANTPLHAKLTIELEGEGAPFRSASGGPARAAMDAALAASYGQPTTTQGQGGSIPLCNVFADTYPDAEIMLIGVEEPKCLIHAPNESVDPSEIQHMALAEAIFLTSYGHD